MIGSIAPSLYPSKKNVEIPNSDESCILTTKI